ncbi:MAG: DUF1700 domain-containing protein [Ruminococcaceae bacterium]|nr:DUF1700 domain-containing protein [Oscillospiraceae bacterium]
MCKREFLDALAARLSALSPQEREERLSFYSEMIDDRIEEGCPEENAVTDIGSIEEIVAQILSDAPHTRREGEIRTPKKALGAWAIVLIIIGFPLWFSLAIAAFAVVLSVYVVLWSMLVSLWAVFAALVACSLSGMAAGGVALFGGHSLFGMAMVGASLALAGLAILLFLAVKATTGGTVWLTKRLAFRGVAVFSKKEKVS